MCVLGLNNEVAVDVTGTRIADFELLHMSNADAQIFKVISVCVQEHVCVCCVCVCVVT